VSGYKGGEGDRTVRYPAKTSIVLTKAEASRRHIEAAMTAFEEEQFDVSITLAGAAEGMVPKPPGSGLQTGPTLFPFLRDHPRIAAEGVEKTDWITALNAERDWLKHTGPTHAPTMEFERWAAAYMLYRAIDKFQAAFGFQDEAIDFKFRLWMTQLNAVLFK
jgi:hypothetical protein